MHNLVNFKGHMIQSPRHTTDLYTHIQLYNNYYTIITSSYHINGLYFLYKVSICFLNEYLHGRYNIYNVCRSLTIQTVVPVIKAADY